MKAHSRIRRALRTLALTGCLSALALPAAAGARPIDYHPLSPQAAAAIASSNQVHAHGRPAAFAGTGSSSFRQPAGFTTDAQTNGTPGTGSSSYRQPAGFTTDAQTNGTPSTIAQSPSVVVREVRTITSGSNHTLALVLASAALGIALCGTAYAVIRTTRIQRRVAGSSS
jgi:hypothetical protein